MNYKLFSSLTASLLLTTLGIPIPGNADSGKPPLREAESTVNSANLESTGSQAGDSTPSASTQTSANQPNLLNQPFNPPSSRAIAPGQIAQLNESVTEVEKVGEQASPAAKPPSGDAVAKVHSHQLSGRKAATVYVKNVPVLTFIGSSAPAVSDVKVGEQPQKLSTPESSAQAKSLDVSSRVAFPPLTSLVTSSRKLTHPFDEQLDPSLLETSTASSDPVWKATVIAARLNQLHRDGMNADTITVVWDGSAKAKGDRFLIKSDTTVLAMMDTSVRFSESTRNLEKDALQATNRLRRLLGDAPPLREVAGKPDLSGRQIALGAIKMRLSGFASWYGPGFHGNPSASGERFNENAMTAAHRTLPFGTRVLVTNVDNGQSVVVRINDRGPFHGNRVIDLSTAAARILGLIQSGVAPVRLEVLDSQTAALSN
jgi:rare lipoprotein A